MRFRMNVHKMKCSYCDLIFLVEEHNTISSWDVQHGLICPKCRGEEVHSITHMDDITIVQVEE